MTEDDTFDALRRIPFKSVLKELGNRAGTPTQLSITKNIWSCDNDNLDPHWIDFFRERGWTVKEFEEECKKK